MPHTIQSLLTHDKAALEAALGLDASSARIEVQCLLQAVLQVNRAYLLTHPEQILGAEQQAHYAALFERRLHGEPLAYILGEREFYGLTFKVTSATLIPKSKVPGSDSAIKGAKFDFFFEQYPVHISSCRTPSNPS